MQGKQKFPAVCEPNQNNMKTYLITALVASLCFACERKEVTINPPGETKETTIVTPAPAITPGGTTTEKTETTEKK